MISDRLLKLVQGFEGFRSKAYKDVTGIWTVGWGSTGSDIGPGLIWTQAQADERLIADLEKFQKGVEDLLVVEGINQNQKDALTSFAYNCGLGNLKQSTLLRCINKHNSEQAANEFLRWSKAGGVEVPGLLRRRKAERELFLLKDGK